MKTFVLTGLLAALLAGCNTEWRGRRGSDEKRSLQERHYRLAEYLAKLRDENFLLYRVIQDDLENVEEMLQSIKRLEDNQPPEELSEELDSLKERVSLLEAKICEIEKGTGFRAAVNPPPPIEITSAECLKLLFPEDDSEEATAAGPQAGAADGTGPPPAVDKDQAAAPAEAQQPTGDGQAQSESGPTAASRQALESREESGPVSSDAANAGQDGEAPEPVRGREDATRSIGRLIDRRGPVSPREDATAAPPQTAAAEAGAAEPGALTTKLETKEPSCAPQRALACASQGTEEGSGGE